MKTGHILGLGILAAMLTVAMPVTAQQPLDPSRPGVVTANLVTIHAIVMDIDKANRTVVLRSPEGKEVTVKVDPVARNFDQIAKGDKVTTEFYEETAIFVRTATEQPTAGQANTVAVAPKGDKPGVIDVTTTEITARVEAIDYANRTVDLRGPQGNVRTLKVGDEVKRLNEVKVGDEVVVRNTQAVAINVTKE